MLPMVLPDSSPARDEIPEQDPFEGTPYRVRDRIALGGMGAVYLVEHRKLGRELVAKILHDGLAADHRLVDRMRLEAQALGRLRHPHVVSVVGFDATSDGRPFLVLERLRGKTLADELVARKALPPLEAVTYTCQLLSALEAAHGLGIVHRDVKPENLFICDRPDGRRFAKVIDFGVARVLPNAAAGAPRPLSLPTDTGVVVGTPRFVSPEGAMGRRVDQRADVYGAALVLYTMLAGRGPFDHVKGETQILSAHLHHEPAPLSDIVKEPIPADLDVAVAKALRKNPDERYQTAREFCESLVAAARDLPSAAGIWSTTDILRAEAAAAGVPALGPATVSSGEHAISRVSTRNIEPLSDSPEIESRAALELVSRGWRLDGSAGRRTKLMLVIVFFVVLIVTAVAVALLANALRGVGGAS